VDHKQALRLVAGGHRLLTEGNARIERQRAIISRLEGLGVDSAKQHDQQAQLVAEALEWVKSEPTSS
jgi:hypothetical protein